MDSILNSIKKLLGIGEEYTHFDGDLILHINSVFSILTQLGVGPAEGFFIADESAKWSDFIEEGTGLDMVKSYVQQKVRLLFDPPISAPVMDAMNRVIGEMEWRLQVAAESKETEE